jgi:hypothetical protein
MPAITLQIGRFLHRLALHTAVFFGRLAGAGRVSAFFGFFCCHGISLRSNDARRKLVVTFRAQENFPVCAVLSLTRNTRPS